MEYDLLWLINYDDDAKAMRALNARAAQGWRVTQVIQPAYMDEQAGFLLERPNVQVEESR